MQHSAPHSNGVASSSSGGGGDNLVVSYDEDLDDDEDDDDDPAEESGNGGGGGGGGGIDGPYYLCSSDFYTPVIDELIEDLKSVSVQDLHMQIKMEEHRSALRAIVEPHQRGKLFNGSYKIWKRRDLQHSVQSYKCGQCVEVRVSHVCESRHFYVQQASRIADLQLLERCMHNYVSKLLEEPSDEFYSFQANSAKFDVVLAKSRLTNRWHRAVYMDRVCFADDDYGDDDDADNDNDNTYNSSSSSSSYKRRGGARGGAGYRAASEQRVFHTFHFVDWGREETFATPANPAARVSELFIMPVHEKIMRLGSFALKCSLNEAHTRVRAKYGQTISMEMERLFERCFARTMLERTCTMRISHTTASVNALEANVELYFLPADYEALHAALLHSQMQLLSSSTRLNSTASSSSSLLGVGGDDDTASINGGGGGGGGSEYSLASSINTLTDDCGYRSSSPHNHQQQQKNTAATSSRQLSASESMRAAHDYASNTAASSADVSFAEMPPVGLHTTLSLPFSINDDDDDDEDEKDEDDPLFRTFRCAMLSLLVNHYSTYFSLKLSLTRHRAFAIFMFANL